MSINGRTETAVEIRPGVHRPDWSIVTTPAARAALGGRTAARAGLLDMWSHALEAAEDQVWRTTLRLYGDSGRPPRIDEIAERGNLSEDRVRALLRKLQLRDLVGLEPGTDAIRYAYPFTQAETGHLVWLKGKVLYALCAIDALGVGAMYCTDATVQSTCRMCREMIRVETGDGGRSLLSVSPSDAIVWYDFAYGGDAAASSCCPAIAFFCSSKHLLGWLDEQIPRRQGVSLAMDEALEVGRAIFGPILREPSSENPAGNTGSARRQA